MGDSVIIEYYEGAYGPTIRIDVSQFKHLIQIRGLFLNLARRKVKMISVRQMMAGKISGFEDLVLQVVNNNNKSYMHLAKEGNMFFWSSSKDQWYRCALLVKRLIQKGTPGHQYLTIEGVDDALVEVAFRES